MNFAQGLEHFCLSVYNAHKLLWSPTLRKEREGWGTRSFFVNT